MDSSEQAEKERIRTFIRANGEYVCEEGDFELTMPSLPAQRQVLHFGKLNKVKRAFGEAKFWQQQAYHFKSEVQKQCLGMRHMLEPESAGHNDTFRNRQVLTFQKILFCKKILGLHSKDCKSHLLHHSLVSDGEENQFVQFKIGALGGIGNVLAGDLRGEGLVLQAFAHAFGIHAVVTRRPHQ